MENDRIDLSLLDELGEPEPRQCYPLSQWNAWKFSRLNQIAPPVEPRPILLRKKRLFSRGKTYGLLADDQPILFNDKNFAKNFLKDAATSYERLSKIKKL